MMIIPTVLDILAIMPAIALGFLIIVNVHGLKKDTALLSFFAGAGLGLGLHSLLFFIGFATQMSVYFQLFFEGILIIFLFVRAINAAKENDDDEMRVTTSSYPWMIRIFSIVLLLSCINTAYNFFDKAWQMPHGNGDAYMCWNLKARFMFIADASNWSALFTPSFTHPDYPLLVPGAMAATWSLRKFESPFVPMLIHFCFAAGVIGLLYTSLNRLKSKMTALLAAMFVICMPFFVRIAVDQFADLPLSYFYLLSFVFLTMAMAEKNQPGQFRLFALTGVAAALSAWTKNEGMLFFLTLTFSIVAVLFINKMRTIRPWLLSYFFGAAVVMVVVLVFKVALVPPNNLVVAEQGTTLSRLTDVSRYVTVIRAYFFTGMSFGQWLITPIPGVLAYLMLSGLKANQFRQSNLVILMTVLCLLTGYVFVYVLFYFEHIGTSLDRLFLQVMPSCVFLFFMATRTPEEILSASNLARGSDHTEASLSQQQHIR